MNFTRTTRILVISTEDGSTHTTEYVPGEDGVTLDHERDTPRRGLDWGYGSDDLTATLSMVNPTITHYTSTTPVGSAHVARHLGVLPEPRDYLQYQWENAEVPTCKSPIRKGDTLIRKDHGTAFDVWVCETEGRGWEVDARILHRDPWRGTRFAVNEDGRRAMRMDGGHWRTSKAELYPHAAFADEAGWRPVEGGDDDE